MSAMYVFVPHVVMSVFLKSAVCFMSDSRNNNDNKNNDNDNNNNNDNKCNGLLLLPASS